ncbi:MAG: hypothetical protein HYR56_11650 [Acidobacteria bacterium]|nr:hypothetical protein [Acidobacteriota bacterium]MBI3426398.1 hypothetical protein [Acidobacteriota bacterium]
MNDKIIVTNVAALRKKYGKGLTQIQTAWKKLIAADKARGLKTRVIALDSAAAMKPFKVAAVTDPSDTKQNKQAIDAVYRALLPEYLMILGAVDVVPHQDLLNPVFDGDNDPDKFAYGDLPYACDAPYSQKVQDFIGPTRVMGRLPDLTGGKDPAYLVGLLTTAATAQQRPASEYQPFLGISAKVWEKSTTLSLTNLFGAAATSRTSPTQGPNWTAAQLNARAHFINCHGAPADAFFYGQSGNKFPQAHSAAFIAGKLSEGTVAAMECCYGAELFDPTLLVPPQMPICNTYLADKAYGYLGSTTIAYGPAEGNSAADLLCQFFLKHVLQGASLGRAVLEARQEFASHASALDPVDLKTLGQFNLLGDPSIQPVTAPSPKRAMAKALSAHDLPHERIERRQQLAQRGAWLIQNQAVAQPIAAPKATARGLKAKAAPAASGSPQLKQLIAAANMESVTTQSFEVTSKVQPKTRALAKSSSAQMRIHVLLGARKTIQPTQGLKPTVAIVAKEVNGKVVSFQELLAK